jgi:hypothetical protein
LTSEFDHSDGGKLGTFFGATCKLEEQELEEAWRQLHEVSPIAETTTTWATKTMENAKKVSAWRKGSA